MKCISLIQPWASLVVAGRKRFETRSWSTSYRGPLLIHASRRFPDDCKDLCVTEPFAAALRLAGFPELHDDLAPLCGLVLGVVEVTECTSMRDITVSEPERSFGDWRLGRFAWQLANPRPLKQPLPWRGSLGIYDVPDEMLAQILPG